MFSIKNKVSLAIALIGVSLSSSTWAQEHSNYSGYLTDSRGQLVKNSTGLCWHTGSWTPENGVEECGELYTKKQMPVVVFEGGNPIEEPIPSYAQKPLAQTAVLSEAVLFNFNRATLTPAGARALDSLVETAHGIKGKISLVLITGHTDPIGSEGYNYDLSIRRAKIVAAYLIAKGFDPRVIETRGAGESEPIPSVLASCDGKRGAPLRRCFAPLRRSTVEVHFQ